MDSYTPLVKKLLTEAGCSLFCSGKGDHEIWYSPLTQHHFPVDPAIKSRHTANGVLKQAGLPKAF
ncbi:MAG: type II toxin-antitoxin system HicA family toxin [Candidatus Competibacteraceae bacterium]|nr:MAG: type II toxin-antitoxin system HicA family toxin [Candidatus Competibacteraceae bacterium]